MNIREKQEQTEQELLSPYATLSSQTRGREKPEVECELRTCFQRDRDRIVHCKAFRRLKDKTQVFLSPKGDHYRTRLTHTLEVSQNARTIARALNLNELLTEAIALGHDLGHTPFGHAGERALNELNPEGFRHNLQSVRVVECLEKNGQGLNLTWEVREGMKNHSTHSVSATLEGKIVRLADKIAYINHDIDDSIRAGVMKESDLPAEYTDVLGHTVRERINNIICDIVKHSEDKDDILMSEEVHTAMFGLRRFMFDHVYFNPQTKKEEKKVHHIIEPLFEYYLLHTDLLPVYSRERIGVTESREQAVCDYIAGMTDHFAIETYKEIFIPKFWLEK
ncbi:deoxyguanosinetriphosphate triphosphohydrolase [Anaerostipes sp.]|uniref:deoxyguanosinetriphosphate triphosphohydrolase n=1 Tax=Anaerostipes sp. TaxID=1872530 RepID=UPI0025BEACD9|nr:deoxyguanosinetriphosphate triphosphohydrolase [Anaerostipes sp.]MBS7008359.1 deoxyguanosinetriphosphate triphosphohydrolase [Anaerostipes sp.]